MVNEPDLKDIKRQLKNIEHELDEFAKTRPRNGAEITIALRKVQEAGFFVDKAEEKK